MNRIKIKLKKPIEAEYMLKGLDRRSCAHLSTNLTINHQMCYGDCWECYTRAVNNYEGIKRYITDKKNTDKSVSSPEPKRSDCLPKTTLTGEKDLCIIRNTCGIKFDLDSSSICLPIDIGSIRNDLLAYHDKHGKYPDKLVFTITKPIGTLFGIPLEINTDKG